MDPSMGKKTLSVPFHPFKSHCASTRVLHAKDGSSGQRDYNDCRRDLQPLKPTIGRAIAFVQTFLEHLVRVHSRATFKIASRRLGFFGWLRIPREHRWLEKLCL